MTRRKRKAARDEQAPGSAAATTDSEPPYGDSDPPPSDHAGLRAGRSAIEEATTARLDLGDERGRDSDEHERDHERAHGSADANAHDPAREPKPAADHQERVPADPQAADQAAPANAAASAAAASENKSTLENKSAVEPEPPPAAARRPSSDPPPPPPRRSVTSAASGDLPPVPRASAASPPAAARAASKPPAEPVANGEKKTSSVAPDAIGRTLDNRYLIEERLGVGGVGAVYLGTQLALGRSVAIKLLHEGLDPSFRARFEREAKALAALRHPNIVSVTDYGLDGVTPYLVMEKLEGETLGDRLTRGPLLPEHVLELSRELLRALGFVHEQGLVHRDLKPGNLFLELMPDGDERLKLLDFGLAKFVQEPGVEGQTVTRAGHVVGTPAYMAPEQIAGDAVDARSDIYAVGVLLYQALCGRVPFEGEPMEQLKGHLVATVPPLVTPQGLKPRAELNALIMRALEKRRDARFGSALEMLVAVEAVPQPWLLDAALIDDDADDDAGAVAKTVVHQGAAKRHAIAQKQNGTSSWGSRARLAFLLTLGVIALIGVQRLRSRLPVDEPSTAVITPTAVPADPAAEAKPGAAKGEHDVDMVIALPEAANEAAGAAGSGVAAATEVAAQPSAAQAGEQAAVVALAQPEQPSEQPADQPATAAPSPVPAQAGQPSAWRNPWQRETPAVLRSIRKAVMDGASGNDRTITILRKYNRTADAHDPRGHLLLARMYLNRGWRDDALNQYATAYQVDPASRGAPKMLSDLLSMVAYAKSSRDASLFVRNAYGSEALRELDRAIVAYKQDPAAVARLKALRVSIAGA